MLLEKLQHLAQQDAESSALLERARMENDALTTELERSQEVGGYAICLFLAFSLMFVRDWSSITSWLCVSIVVTFL